MRRTPRLLAFLLATVAVGALSCDGDGGGGGSAPVDLATLSAPGPYLVGSRTLDLVDTSRATPANGSYPGSPERLLPAIVWYPLGAATAEGAETDGSPSIDGPFPLIGYAHGFASSRDEGRVVGGHLASHGYVVVAVTFPLSNGAAPGGKTIIDMASQPADLAFAMDEVAAGAAGSDLGGAIDSSRRGIIGLSLGGGTVLFGVYHPKWRIEDIDAAVALAPASCFFGRDFYARSLPVLILSGSADMLVPLASGPVHAFDYAPPPVTLAALDGGNHVGFIGIGVDGPRNADAIVGCPVIGAGGSIVATGGAALAEKIEEGAGPGAVDLESCSTGICGEELPQTMSADRQLELTRAAALAHFEATLRGRSGARHWLEQTLGETNSDVTVQVKR